MHRFVSKSFYFLLTLILLVITLRIFLMSSLPLSDTTEARYGELARVTATGNYWLMPHMTPTQPFFAKPPLSTWFASASWLSFGHNEFALRLPSLILALLSCCALLYGANSLKLSRQQWLFACFVILTTPIGFISAGAVMTDATQLAVVTWAMVFLWRIIQVEATDSNVKSTLKFDRLGLWLMLGIGTIAKGLATLVLIGLPVLLFWAFLPKAVVLSQFKRIWSWLGVVIFLSIVLAWYIPAEIYYPGFIKYFIVGEHFERFLEPAWKGDMYGIAHLQRLGMIWVFWIASIAIWVPMFISGLHKDRPLFNSKLAIEKKWLWAWVLAPLLFFTFSRNIIWTYTLTALPAFAVLAATSWSTLSPRFKKAMQLLVACWLLAMFIATLIWMPQMVEEKSARKLVLEANSKYPNMPLFLYGNHEFSASYYTNGRITIIETPQKLDELLLTSGNLLILSTELAKDTELHGHGKILDVNAAHALLVTKN